MTPPSGRALRIAILWTGWSGYMDACARALQALTGAELHVVCDHVRADAPFRPTDFFGYPCRTLDLAAMRGELASGGYDLMLISGWHVPVYRHIARAAAGRARRVLCMDNQWQGTARQYLGIGVFRASWRALFDYAFVPGERQGAFARRLGFAAGHILEGHLSCDTPAFLAGPEPSSTARTILYVGRLAPEKGLDVLDAAWRGFCADGRHRDWRLQLCGAGPLEPMLAQLPQVELTGFVQPGDLPARMRTAAALVLPSRREPWGLVVHEAAAAGLPLILTDRCGAGDAFLRPGWNGYRVDAQSSNALRAALVDFAALPEDARRAMAARSRALGVQRTPETWARAAVRALA